MKSCVWNFWKFYSTIEFKESSFKNVGKKKWDDLDDWDEGWVGERSKREGIYVYIQLIHFIVW